MTLHCIAIRTILLLCTRLHQLEDMSLYISRLYERGRAPFDFKAHLKATKTQQFSFLGSYILIKNTSWNTVFTPTQHLPSNSSSLQKDIAFIIVSQIFGSWDMSKKKKKWLGKKPLYGTHPAATDTFRSCWTYATVKEHKRAWCYFQELVENKLMQKGGMCVHQVSRYSTPVCTQLASAPPWSMMKESLCNLVSASYILSKSTGFWHPSFTKTFQ